MNVDDSRGAHVFAGLEMTEFDNETFVFLLPAPLIHHRWQQDVMFTNGEAISTSTLKISISAMFLHKIYFTVNE